MRGGFFGDVYNRTAPPALRRLLHERTQPFKCRLSLAIIAGKALRS